MSGSSTEFWSDDPNAPRIPYPLYLAEKENFAGNLIGAIFYGIVIVLFFLCLGALFNPINRAGGIKWPLVVHTTAMFSFATVYTAMNLHLQSISYIDNREFPGAGDTETPGPLGYQLFVYSKPISLIPGAMFTLNQWLADGLLLYRCYAIYSMKFWVIAFPCLMWVASVATGVTVTYYQTQPDDKIIDFGTPYFLISLLLNFFLTVMIVVRLVRHTREIQSVGRPLLRHSRFYKQIVAIFVESSALYVICFLLYIGPWGARNSAQFIFFPVLAQIQVISPFLIVLRASKQRASMNNSIVSEDIGSVHLSQMRPTDSGITSHSLPTKPTDKNGVTQSVEIDFSLQAHQSEA